MSNPPRPALDRHTLADDNSATYHALETLKNAVVSAAHASSAMPAFDAAMDAHLHSLRVVHLLELVDTVIQNAVAETMRAVDDAAYSGEPVKSSGHVPVLVRLLDRIDIDHAGMAFVAASLFGAFAYHSYMRRGSLARGTMQCVADHLLFALIDAPRLVRPYALRLTWDYARESAAAWAARGPTVYQIGAAHRTHGQSVMTTAQLNRWMHYFYNEDELRSGWDKAVRDGKQKLDGERSAAAVSAPPRGSPGLDRVPTQGGPASASSSSSSSSKRSGAPTQGGPVSGDGPYEPTGSPGWPHPYERPASGRAPDAPDDNDAAVYSATSRTWPGEDDGEEEKQRVPDSPSYSPPSPRPLRPVGAGAAVRRRLDLDLGYATGEEEEEEEEDGSKRQRTSGRPVRLW